MIADINIRFSVDQESGNVTGFARIDQFSEYEIVGHLS
jgi:hypothetical protein